MRLKIDFEMNRHQADFFQDDTSSLLHLSTGFGGGKTYALCMKALRLSQLNKDCPGGLVVPDFQDFKRDVLPEMLNILQRFNIPYKYHGSDHYFQFPWSKGKLYCVSAEKPIRGPNWGFAVVNEVTLIPLLRYKEVIGRVRDKRATFPQIASCGTPEGYVSEYYDYFIENPPPGLRLVYGSTDDNAHNLNSLYLTNLESAFDSKMIDAYRRGLWINMNGSRFYYAHDPAKNEDLGLIPELFNQFHCSMDFNVDPFCATLWGYDGATLYGVDQIELKGGEGYSTQNMIQALGKRGYTPSNTIIYPDPAGKSRRTSGDPDVVILQRAGYTVRVKTAAPSFRRRQLNTNNLLDKSRVKYNPKRCQGIRKDFLGVEQDLVTLEKRKNNPQLTHFSDGFDYLVDILFPFNGDPKATRLERIR